MDKLNALSTINKPFFIRKILHNARNILEKFHLVNKLCLALTQQIRPAYAYEIAMNITKLNIN